MPTELTVDVNEVGLYTLSVPESFETAEPFTVRLINHGNPVHVHLQLDDSLARAAAIEATTHHLDAESERYVRVDVDTDAFEAESVQGRLTVAVGHGTETRQVSLTLMTPEAAGKTVRVDESLAEPQPHDSVSLADYPQLVVLALAALALALAAAVALAVDATVVLAGALIVLGGVFLALVFLVHGLVTGA